MDSSLHLVPGRCKAAHCSWGVLEEGRSRMGKKQKINSPRPHACLRVCVCVCVCVLCVCVRVRAFLAEPQRVITYLKLGRTPCLAASSLQTEEVGESKLERPISQF